MFIKTSLLFSKKKGAMLLVVLFFLLIAFLFSLAIIQGIEINGTYVSMAIRQIKALNRVENGLVRGFCVTYYTPGGNIPATSHKFSDGGAEVSVTMTEYSGSNKYKCEIKSETEV